MNPSFSRSRKWRIGFNVSIALLSAFALVVMANYLAARHPIRYYWSNAAANKLSPLTVRVLENLTNNVKVIIFFKGRDQEPLFNTVSSLLKDYQSLSSRIQVEYVDYRYPGRGTMVMNQYKLSGATEGSQVIFDSNGNVQSVSVNELSEFAMGKDGQFRRTKFKGEQLFTSAILGVTSLRRPKAYFLTGHGEANAESDDEQNGYSRFARMLKATNVELDLMDSLHHRDVPEDCSLLIIPGPTTRFAPEELERLDRYLTQGGRLFVLFPMISPGAPPIGLETLLNRWNVDVGMNIVRDEGQSQSSQQYVVIASQYGSHPITRPLLRSKIGLLAPRVIGSRATGAPRADAPKTTELIFTSEKAAALGGFRSNRWSTIDRQGTIPLAVAVEKGGIQGVAADRGATRIVVASSSVSFGNGAIEMNGNNGDFAQLAANWLLSRDILLSDIQPRAITEFQLTATASQMKTLRWIFLAAAPGGALLIGIIVWLRRRK